MSSNKNTNKDTTKETLRVLHFSTHNEQCGIGRYQEMFIEAMSTSSGVHNEFFPVSPNVSKAMSKLEFQEMLNQLDGYLRGYDVLHVQHEFSFFADDEMGQILSRAKDIGIKTIVTVHTSPNIVYKKLRITGIGPRSWLHYARKYKRNRWLFRSMIDPLKNADKVLVHNNVTQESLVRLGVDEGRIDKITIPVPVIDHQKKSTKIKESLSLKSGDIVMSTVGFLHRYKGLKEAINALCFLPANYKLAVVGGLHPFTDDVKIYDEIANLILDRNLQDRVFITGYIENDDEMNALIRETDVCVYPYDKEYYSNVSSAALNNSFANHVPPVVYPTASFVELDEGKGNLTLTSTFSYYELARSVRELDIKKAKRSAIEFAEEKSYKRISQELVDIYKTLSSK